MVDKRVRRTWDEAQTPAQRLLARAILEPAQREMLEGLRTGTNPRVLRDEIYTQLNRILLLVPFSARAIGEPQIA
jgi:hypothetical protein